MRWDPGILKLCGRLLRSPLLDAPHRDNEPLNQHLWEIIPFLQKGTASFLAAAGEQRFIWPGVVVQDVPHFNLTEHKGKLLSMVF